ncbi:MAG: hypothetical protein ACOCQC_02645 [Halanaerobiaceae bacterium]
MKLLFFAHKEAVRLFCSRYKFSLRIFNRLVFLFLILGINIYLLQDQKMMSPVSTSGMTLRYISWKKLLFVVFFLLGFCVFEFNRKIIQEYIAEYREEIDLIKKLNIDKEIGKVPLIYIVIIFNLISSLAAGILIYAGSGALLFLGTERANIFGREILLYLLGAGLIASFVGAVYAEKNIQGRINSS